MKAKDVCRLFNIHRQCLSRWVKKGKVQVKLMPNGRYDYIITTEQELSKIDPRFKAHFVSLLACYGIPHNKITQIEEILNN